MGGQNEVNDCVRYIVDSWTNTSPAPGSSCRVGLSCSLVGSMDAVLPHQCGWIPLLLAIGGSSEPSSASSSDS